MKDSITVFSPVVPPDQVICWHSADSFKILKAIHPFLIFTTCPQVLLWQSVPFLKMNYTWGLNFSIKIWHLKDLPQLFPCWRSYDVLSNFHRFLVVCLIEFFKKTQNFFSKNFNISLRLDRQQAITVNLDGQGWLLLIFWEVFMVKGSKHGFLFSFRYETQIRLECSPYIFVSCLLLLLLLFIEVP